MKLIETKTVTTAQTTVTFSDIPQNFQDLYVLTSLRDTSGTAGWATAEIRPNGSTSNITSRALYGFGTTIGGLTTAEIYHQATQGGNTANTFSNSSVQILNYTAAKPKQISVDTATEGNIANTINAIVTGQWDNTAPITSLSFVMASSATFAPGSTISLYGIGGAGDPGIFTPKATGGTISLANGYWVHTFTASGTFTPTADLSNVEYLVIAGGGSGGGFDRGGGGGAGGYRSSVVGESSGGGSSAETRLSLTNGTNYTVTVGAGGASVGSAALGINGNSSVFGTITSTGGGGGGQINFNSGVGVSGGSGSGAGISPGGDQIRAGGNGTANQGFNGGSSFHNYVNFGNAGGGGGAGSVGASVVNTSGIGHGGSGVSSSITGSSITRAGGGGGGGASTANGGSGGGGSAGTGAGSDGTLNTGGGGGGGGFSGNSGAGGSGIVIVRYAA